MKKYKKDKFKKYLNNFLKIHTYMHISALFFYLKKKKD